MEVQREKDSGEAKLVEETERSETERSEVERSVGTGTNFARSSSRGGGGTAAAPDPEVPAIPKRRRYSAEYKLEILKKPKSLYQSSSGASVSDSLQIFSL